MLYEAGVGRCGKVAASDAASDEGMRRVMSGDAASDAAHAAQTTAGTLPLPSARSGT